MGSTPDCSTLTDLDSFPKYIDILRNITAFNLTLLGDCRSEICAALWGVGNPDVSGVGTIAGYFFESILGFLLAVACLVYQRSTSSLREPIWKGLAVFYDSATYFALSILVASVYSLAMKDYDISAAGFGAFEVQITWVVDVVCILPLIYPMILLPKNCKQEVSHYTNSSDYEKLQRNHSLREKFRVVLLGLIITVFTYSFVSQCMHNWAPSQIGVGNGPGGRTIITQEEYRNLTTTCFGDTRPLASAESRTISAFVMIGSIIIYLFTVWSLINSWTGNRDLWRILPGQRLAERTRELASRSKEKNPYLWRLIQIVLFLGPVLLAAPLFWGILRLRRLQRDLAKATRNVYADNEWTFGQVVSIIIFAPVLFEILYSWLEY